MSRPRKHINISDRVAASRTRLIESGGGRREFRLSAEAIKALNLIRETKLDPTDSALVERLLKNELQVLLLAKIAYL